VRGDVIIVEEHHRQAAERIATRLAPAIAERTRRTTLAVAGESGSGKSEMAQALLDSFEQHDLRTTVLQQDDYFVLPPRQNDAARRRDIGWVGPSEVRLDVLDEHLAAVWAGARSVTKPLVIYAEDRTVEETLDLDGSRVVIAEGTYTTLLEHVDDRIFIARNRLETLAARRRRAREAPDPFIEDVLEIEHRIISAHRARASVIISRDYEVEFAQPVVS
jgi:uridine kinase